MTDRDSELDQLLNPLIDLKPKPQQMQNWKDLPHARKDRKKEATVRIAQLAAACLIGFVVGLYAKSTTVDRSRVAANFDESATRTVVYTKSE